jgi:hypothetical protein
MNCFLNQPAAASRMQVALPLVAVGKCHGRRFMRGRISNPPSATDANHEVALRSNMEGRISKSPRQRRRNCAHVIRDENIRNEKRWIAFALSSRIIFRGERTILGLSREQCVPKEGGLETRPYMPPDLCAASRKGDTRGLPQWIWNSKPCSEQMLRPP